MSVYSERTALSLHNMIREMYRKKIELARITKCSTQLIMAGATPNSIPMKIVDDVIQSQNEDGGFVANSDTIWNSKFLEFYPPFSNERAKAIEWLKEHRTGLGYGRSIRDMGRIPVTGLAFYLLPELCEVDNLKWLEDLWISEKNSLTYKAAYSLMAFSKNTYLSSEDTLIKETIDWLACQQEEDGGFAPWKGHPVGTNVYCTAVSCLGLMSYPEIVDHVILEKAYSYLTHTQLKNGLWAYHELEDGAAWGLRALVEMEKMGM